MASVDYDKKETFVQETVVPATPSEDGMKLDIEEPEHDLFKPFPISPDIEVEHHILTIRGTRSRTNHFDS